MEFNHKIIEEKWLQYWEENKTFKTDTSDFSKPKFYALDMFPYPSGHGLHVGHPEGYTASDIICRMKRMQGYNVLHPMGFDSFGLPAEQYAINTGNHPGGFTEENIKTFTSQLKMLGFSYDWDRQISTCDPSFYKWTQWIFLQLFEAGLARQIDMPVNWCEELGTVLANDEIINGVSERGGFPVVKKNMKQWVMDIPSYAEKLLEGLDHIDWPESTKEMQRNWIGKSQGAYINFKVKNTDLEFTVFTTRSDTLFGATFCVLSPEHKIVKDIVTEEQRELVENYIAECAKKSEMERTDGSKEKTGLFTGAYAINPVNGKEIPIYVADYVLVSYGTGAIMAVPAHDERDYAFAKKYNIEIIQVLEGGNIEVAAHTEDGLHINSDFLNGLNKEEALEVMSKWLEENKIGKKTTTYRLREWVFARQRYWGEPVPIAFLEDGTPIALTDLPVTLPELTDYKGKNGKAPLDNATEWKNITINGLKATREVNTMPGSAGSSWYFLRYIDPHNDNEFANYDLLKHWMPVDLYIGGSEHAVGHLLYSRFWNQFLYDKGLAPTKEPFQKLCHQGMILGENGEKMSKSRGNVINPNEIVSEFGADTLRMYEMFMGPLQDAKPWNSKNIEGTRKFLERVWRLYTDEKRIKDEENTNLVQVYHQTIKKITEDYEKLNFNTAISQMMIFVNAVYKEEVFPTYMAKDLLKMLNPICPFMTEELWQVIFNEPNSITYAEWPKYDESKLMADTYTLVVQVNGKLRDRIEVATNTTNAEIEKIALESEKIKIHIDGLTVVKVVVVPKKLVNIVVR